MRLRGARLFLLTPALFQIWADVPQPGVRATSPATFSVATWNVRSGMGSVPSGVVASFDMNTANCMDPLRPRNAWGMGFVQEHLELAVRQDARMVALGVQEGWGSCGNLRNIAATLQWPAVSPERGGVGMIARYGIIGPWDLWQIEFRNVAGAAEDRWIVGGNICIDRDCIRTVYMWTTHLSANIDEEWPQHVGRVLDWLASKPLPHLFMGDLNIWRIDEWSPATNCGNPTPAMATALSAIDRAGYRDAWAATQLGEGWTAMLSRPGCGAARDGGAYKRVDYIWSKGLQALSTIRVGLVQPGTPAPSDHFGVKAEFVTR
jgi:hypothetical protein